MSQNYFTKLMQTQYNDPKGAIGATKTPLGLIPPYAMEQTSWVHKLGSEKYGSHNWRKTGVCASTYVNAILRHLNAWRDGEDLDPESGISHIAHVACCCNILLDAEYCGKLQDDRSKVNSYDKLHKLLSELKKDQEEYRILKSGETLQDGDEVYVGFGDWMTLYIPRWVKQEVNEGTYRRKLITNCDLKDQQSCPECDALAAYGSNDGPCDYHKNKTCDSKPEPQSKVANCYLKEECTCGRGYSYHWLYGWICEDCDLKHQDPYNS